MNSSTSTSELEVPHCTHAGVLRWQLVGALLSLIILLLALEFILRYLPVNNVPFASGSSIEKSIRRMPASAYTWSLGWDFRHVVKGNINADGFVSPYPYRQEQNAVALLGDSFAEGIMLEFSQSLAGQLNHRLDPSLKTYNFGISGASLSHYLGLASEVRKNYRFSAAVIVVNQNDYIEGFQPQEGFYRWTEPADSRLLGFQPRQEPGFIKRVLGMSALFRYARYHLKFNLGSALSGFTRNGCANETLMPADRERLARYVSQLPDAFGLPQGRVVLVFSGNIDNAYAQVTGRRIASPCMTRDAMALDELRRLADMAGMRIIDAEQVFTQHYREHRQQLDFKPADGHWNAAATAVLAQHIAAFLGKPAKTGSTF
jgi:hypothetical protein